MYVVCDLFMLDNLTREKSIKRLLPLSRWDKKYSHTSAHYYNIITYTGTSLPPWNPRRLVDVVAAYNMLQHTNCFTLLISHMHNVHISLEL